MKIKRTLQYYLRECLRPTGIYYLVMVALMLIIFIFGKALGLEESLSISGMETSSWIFLFVLGLNLFKPQFRLLVQNGISRRTQLFSFILCALIISLGVAVIDSIYPLLFGAALDYSSLFRVTYDEGAAITFQSVLWSTLLNFAAMSVGFFITTLFYRMNKAVKILVCVGVPVLLFVVMPVLEVFIPGFRLFTSMMKFFLWALGIDIATGAVHIWRAFCSFAVLAVASNGLSWLLTRRVTMKEA